MYTRRHQGWVDDDADPVRSVVPKGGPADVPEYAADVANAHYAKLYGWSALQARLADGGLNMAEICALLLDKLEKTGHA